MQFSMFSQLIWRNSLLKCVAQPELAKKFITTFILTFKVIQGH